MKIFTFGLAETSVATTLSTFLRPPTSVDIPGLVHAEFFTQMRLGSSIFSSDRMQLRRLTMFATWGSEEAIEEFLNKTDLGRSFASGWHLRMAFLRRWGYVRQFGDLPENAETVDPSAPVAAYTLARMKLSEVPRFIKWGRPVEQLMRDHPEATLALAAIRYPRSVATFTIWKSLKAMTDMVQGHSAAVERPERHTTAMAERDRRDFHHEFTTLRFKPLSEHGAWQGRSNFVKWA